MSPYNADSTLAAQSLKHDADQLEKWVVQGKGSSPRIQKAVIVKIDAERDLCLRLESSHAAIVPINPLKPYWCMIGKESFGTRPELLNHTCAAAVSLL